MYPKNENRNQRAHHPEFCPSFLNIYFQAQARNWFDISSKRGQWESGTGQPVWPGTTTSPSWWNFLLIICPLPLTRFPSNPRYTFYAVLICFFEGEYPIQRARDKNRGSTTTNNLARFSRMVETPRPRRRGTFCYREKRKRRFPGGKTAKKRFQKIFRPRFNGTLLLILLLKNNEIIQRLIVETESRVEP